MKRCAMEIRYFPENDMLYIQLMDGISTESEEVAPYVVLDFDAENRVVGIEIEDASLNRALKRDAEQLQFQPSRQTLEVQGLCADCRI